MDKLIEEKLKELQKSFAQEIYPKGVLAVQALWEDLEPELRQALSQAYRAGVEALRAKIERDVLFMPGGPIDRAAADLLPKEDSK